MKILQDIVPGVLFLLAVLVVYINAEKFLMLEAYMSKTGGLGEVAYVGALVVAVVCMPITVMPLIPIAATLFGPFVTGILSIIGWSVGAAIAFLIARYFSGSLSKRFPKLDQLNQKISKVSQKRRFLTIVLLRISLPVDFVSYGLGLSRAISFTEFMLATVLGVSWFSFAFAYMGDALLHSNTLVLIEIAAASVLILLFAGYWLGKNDGKS